MIYSFHQFDRLTFTLTVPAGKQPAGHERARSLLGEFGSWLDKSANRVERAAKPFVIGRKNWPFSDTANGAGASALRYSITETAKANGLVP